MRVPLVLAASAALAGSGCSDALDRQSLVTSLRLLAVAADPPEAAPGDRIALAALWHSPAAEPPVFRWSHCAAPADGGVDRCGGVETSLPSGAGIDEAAFRLPGDAPVELVRLTVCDAGDGEGCAPAGDAVSAGKRVEVGTSSTPNTNPGIEGFTVELGAGPDGEARVTLQATAGSVETTEELFVSWFATGGTFEDDRSFAPGPTRFEGLWTPPPDGGDAVLWAVLRDGRGGVSWAEQTIAGP